MNGHTRYLLKHDDAVLVRTDRRALVAGWLQQGFGDPRFSACDTLECFDSPCTFCLLAGDTPDAPDAPLVPDADYIGELADFEIAMRTNGSWDAPDTHDPRTYADPGPCAWDPDLVRVVHDVVLCPLVESGWCRS